MSSCKPYTSSNMSESATTPRTPHLSPKIYPTAVSKEFHITDEIKKNDSIDVILTKVGFSNPTKIASTLQGTIWRATESLTESIETKKSVVIKTTSQYLHKSSISSVNGESNHIQENILLEQSILKFISSQQKCPESIVKFHEFFQTDKDYFLVMDDGGSSLFSFVKKAHKLIKAKRIEMDHWKDVSKLIFKQMLSAIDFIHTKNVCHFDISLENFLINDVNVEIRKSKKTKREMLRFVMSDIQIKLCDFGLAQIFTKSSCKSNKFCGKEGYASPEIMQNKKGFDAKSNDIWCAGVSLFMIATGKSPFNVADKSDKPFLFIMEYGQLLDVLIAWNLLEYIDENLFDLIDSIFQYEPHRINMQQIKQHVWFKSNKTK